MYCQLLCLSCVLLGIAAQDTPHVKIPQGALKGKYFTTRNGRTVSGFLGIPYAAPPVGHLRFKSPQPPVNWTGIRDATQYGNICIQGNILPDGGEVTKNVTRGSEDCLFLNVFTPNVSTSAYLPVMLFIHGGAYIIGSSQTFAGPDYLLDKDVLLVSMNYRLGALGFLTTEDEVLPGNYGLKDQTAALQWVRDNIKYFGGNKDSVTIFGESAGGASVTFHMLSPLSKGLFHAAIAQSGVAYCSWNTYPPGLNKKYALQAGELLGCPIQDSKQLAQCLRNAPAEKLADLTYKFLLWDVDPHVVFRPNIEQTWKGAFLTAYPTELITSVPFMVGLTSEDGSIRVSSITKEGLDKGLKVLNDEFEVLMPLTLMFHGKTKSPQDVVKKIKKFYFGDKKINKEVLQKVIDMYTDSLFLQGITRSIQNHKGPTYIYYFNYKGSATVSPAFGNKKDDLGVCHVDDLLYLFKLENFYPNKPEPTKEDVNMSEKLVELWTNFAFYRNPTPRRSSFTVWEPATSSNFEYLNINNDGFAMKNDLLKERREFWESLDLKENLIGIDQVKKHLPKDEL